MKGSKVVVNSNYVSGVVAFCLFIVAPIFMVGHCVIEKPAVLSAEEIAAKQERIDSIDARTWAKIYVKRSLKAPTTAKFQNPADFGVAPAKDKEGKPLKDVWEVSGYVDAQNSFGVMLRNKWYVKLVKMAEDKWVPTEVIVR